MLGKINPFHNANQEVTKMYATNLFIAFSEYQIFIFTIM